MLQPLRVLFVAPELAPWMKSGGLGDVAHALPLALRQIGVDVRVLAPAYSPLKQAHPDARPVAAFPSLGGSFPPARLFEAETADGLPLLLIDCPAAYERAGSAYQDASGHDWHDNHLRFGLLSRITALLGRNDSPYSWLPRVVHCNDWPCGLAPAYLHYDGHPHVPTVMTVHNLAFQGNFAAAAVAELALPAHAFAVDGVEFYGQLSFLKSGLHFADRLTTVSPRYAEEIQTPEYGCGLDGLLRSRRERLTGILNGIDTQRWNPAADPLIARPYDRTKLEAKADNKRQLQAQLGLPIDTAVPLLGCVARVTYQKGLDLLPQIGDELAALPAQLALLGQGEKPLEEALRALARRFPANFAVVIGYDEALAHLIEAGADMFLMPSRFEPCGLNQMYSLRYGTPPVARATGGLADTVVDCNPATVAANSANGFLFGEPSAGALLAAVRRAIEAWKDPALWRRLKDNGMSRDFGWAEAARRYRSIYGELTQNRPRRV